MPLVYRLNHNNIITLKSPLVSPQNNNQTKPFIGVWDLVTELQVYVQYSIIAVKQQDSVLSLSQIPVIYLIISTLPGRRTLKALIWGSTSSEERKVRTM